MSEGFLRIRESLAYFDCQCNIGITLQQSHAKDMIQGQICASSRISTQSSDKECSTKELGTQALRKLGLGPSNDTKAI